MARTVDPQRHLARRLQIIDAAITCFSRGGIDATTAQICREAGIGSGTFFHYFPAKLDVLRAIIELGMAESEEWFATQSGRKDPLGVLLDHADRIQAEAADPRVPGFVLAVSAALNKPAVADVLADEQRALRAALHPWVDSARERGLLRTDWSPEETIGWILALEDGFIAAVAEGHPGAPGRRPGALRDVIARALRPA